MRIVTSGAPYLDIDAYGGCIAYAELLQAQGFEAQAASSAPLNDSISRTVRSWEAPLMRDYIPSPQDTFTLIDISDPEYFDGIVIPGREESVIDHHVGFERYWQERIGSKARIEFIGAACTLVYEQWQSAGLLERMSQLSARLLVCGILDNTLNFGAAVSTRRDAAAYESLLQKAALPEDWTAQYFLECEESIAADVVIAAENDTKTIVFRTYEQPIRVGQLTLWDAGKILGKDGQSIREELASRDAHRLLNLISVSERKSYFMAGNPRVQRWLSQLLDVEFDGTVAVADRLWLRKEIIRTDGVV